MPHYEQYDIVMIGGGVMSATLAALLYELNPSYKIGIFEKLGEIAKESSDAMNNAGTGHSAFCELNYTPEKADGSVDISKAIAIAESFELSKQFWAYLVQKNYFTSPRVFINRMPHCSLVFGEKDVAYLRTRYEAMQQSPLFAGMEYTEDRTQISSRMPLIMTSRDANIPIAATRMEIGTDIDFGALTRGVLGHVGASKNVEVALHHRVVDIEKTTKGQRTLHVHNTKNNTHRHIHADFVFVGAGGGALPLLQKAGIAEAKQYGGFPVSGQWLVCENPDIIAQHEAKVYGKAALGAPPMSVPHLDTRIIHGKKKLLFGPYAGFTTKFLKSGSLLDLPLSIRLSNIRPMLGAGVHNIPLTKYLIQQVTQSKQARLAALQEYYPDAKAEDWKLVEAGYRVQIIKADPKQGGVLQFGTEVVISADKSMASLLGASPGASTSVDIMLRVVEQCFPQFTVEKIQKMIPTYKQSLHANKALLAEVRNHVFEVLGV